MSTPTIDILNNHTARDQFIDYCEEYGYDVATFGPYRAFQILWIVVATLSMSNIARVYWRYVRRSKLHVNIRTYQLTLSFLAEHPCEVFLPKNFYKCFNILFGVFLELYLFTQTAMAFERAMATIYVRSYERANMYPGIITAASAVLVAVGSQVYLYEGKTFSQPQLSVLNPPAEVYDRINRILIINEVTCGLTTVAMIVLVIVNKKREKKAIGNLSRRFQTGENIDTTKFIAKVSVIQIFTYTSQSLGSLLLRLVEESIVSTQTLPMRTTLKLAIYNYVYISGEWTMDYLHPKMSMERFLHSQWAESLHTWDHYVLDDEQGMPLFTLIMSIVIEYSFRASATNRHNRFKSAVTVRDEAQTYIDFLSKQWRI